MNKNRYRIIYNKARQMFMAVAENAKSQTKTSGQSTSSVATPTSEESFHQLWHVKALVASMSLWMPLSTVYAGMMADTGANAANRPVIGVGQDAQKQNVPVINIQTPNASGVSHNIYKEFDVPTQGAVLNNSRTGAASSIVGSVAANPYLQTGEARIILNEVNSAIASKFEGNLEIAGQQADLIIANPAGINIKGGGFINANKAILTTGKPQLNADGSIKEFVVDQGKITVSANAGSNLGLGGATNNNANYIDLYTRALELNAQLYAKNDIQVITGTNTISADLNKVESKTSTATAPTVAIDVKALGGMYANNIYMVGTEKGLGVNNAGTLQAVNNLVITSAGKIEHSGLISSTSKTQGVVSITTSETGAAGDINSSGSINSNSMLNIDSANNLNVNAKDILINYGGVASSPMLINTKGNLNLAANTRIMNDSVGGDLFVDAANINLGTSSELKSNRGSATIQAQQNLTSSASARLIAAQDLNVLGKGKLSFTNTLLHASLGSINLQAGSSNTQGLIDIQAGTINAAKDLNLSSSGDINLKNLGLAAENSVSRVKNINAYSGQNLKWDNTNIALPQIAGKVQLDAANQMDLIGSTISNKDDINLQANKINLSTALTSQKNINIVSKVNDLILDKAITAQGDINVSALVGNIATYSLKAQSEGKISIIANKNVSVNSSQNVDSMASYDVITTDRTNINGVKGIILGSGGDGAVNVFASDLNSTQGDINLVSNNGIRLSANNDVVVHNDDNGRSVLSSTLLSAKNININNKNSGLILDGGLKLNAINEIKINGGEVNLNFVNIKSQGNVELFAKDNLTLKNVIASSEKHLALNSKGNFNIDNEYIPEKLPSWMEPNSGGTGSLFAKGILSITSADHIANNATYVGGAILVEASRAFITPVSSTLNFNTIDSNFLKNDPSLKELNGNLTIQTNSDLTIDPKIYKLNSIGNIELISKNGMLTLKGYGGANGNGSEQIVGLNTAGGSINLEGVKIDLQGSKLTAQKDIKLISSKEDIIVDGVKNNFNNFASTKYISILTQDVENLNNKINLIKNDNSYISVKNEIASLNAEANSIRGLLNSVLSEYGGNFDPMYTYIGYDSEYGPYIFYDPYSEGGQRGYFVSTAGLDLDRYRQIMNGDLPSEIQKLGLIDNKINAIEQEKSNVNKTINLLNNKTNGYEHAESKFISNTGNITLTSARGISLSGANLTAVAGQVNIEARAPLTTQYISTTIKSGESQAKSLAASIIIDGHTDFYDKGGDNDANYSMRSFISPTVVNGTKGVSIKTIGATASDNLVLQATGITSTLGDVSIESNKNILFDAAIEQSYDRTTSSFTKKSWGGLKKKTITTVLTDDVTSAASVDIYGKNIKIESKEKNPNISIDIYSSKFNADGGTVSIKSGGNLNFLTVEENKNTNVDITKRSTFAGLKYNSSKTNATRSQITELPATLKANYINTQSGFDTRLKGTEFEYLNGATIQAGRDLILLVAKDKITDIVKNESNSVVWQSMQDKGSITETAKLPSFNGPSTPVFQAAGGLIVQVPVGEKDQNKVELRDEIMKLANQPGNAYLKDFVNRKDVDWQKVILAQKDWDYKSQGLTAAGAAILAIAIAAVSGGAGIGAIFGTTGTVTNAALLSLTTQASISLVNNGGNISATFKELGSKESVKSLAITVVTAGLVEGMSASLKIDLQGFPTAEKIANNFVQGVGSTLISSTLQGESLSDGLQKALLVGLSSSLQGEMASKIKGLEDVDYILHKVAHAAAGCISGALLKSCEAGAIGAVVGEIVASSIDTPDSFNTFDELAKHQKLVRDISKLTAGVVAAYTGYDVNVAANSAEIAIRNNRQLNENEIKSIDILAKGDSQKKDRLTVAACALIKCSAGLDPNSVEYKMLIKVENLGNTSDYKAERDLLKQQKYNYDYTFLGYNVPNAKGSDQLFTYTIVDSSLDLGSRINTKYSIGTRAGGVLMVAGGIAGGIVSTGGLVTCVTGIGCLAAGTGLVTSADIASTGLKQVVQGKSQNTLGAMAISEVTGISLATSENIYALVNMGTTIQQIGTGLKVAAQNGVTTLPKVENIQRVCSSGSACFVAGTLIETDKGFKRIEEFVGGELVWSKDELTQKYDYRPVIGTKTTENQLIYKVVIRNQKGIEEILYTTEEHPFWINEKGWLKASLIEPEMQLIDRNNGVLQVVSQEKLARIETVYNIEVDEYHTYHVGKFGTWVHNADCCNYIQKKLKYEIEVNGDSFYKKYDISTNQLFDKNGIAVNKKFQTSYLYSSFNETKGEFYIEKMAAFQPGHYTGREMLSVAVERIGLNNVKIVKAQLADTNKAAFQTAMINTSDPIKAASQTPLGKAMNDLGFKVSNVRDANLSLPWVEFVRK